MPRIQTARPRVQVLSSSRIKSAPQLGATPRTRGRAWMAIRDRIKRRDCGLCQECKRRGRIKPGTEVDHVTALTNGGTNDDDNLELLCADCHETKTNADLGYKPRVTTGLDGWPIEQDSSTGPAWKRKGYR